MDRQVLENQIKVLELQAETYKENIRLTQKKNEEYIQLVYQLKKLLEEKDHEITHIAELDEIIMKHLHQITEDIKSLQTEIEKQKNDLKSLSEKLNTQVVKKLPARRIIDIQKSSLLPANKLDQHRSVTFRDLQKYPGVKMIDKGKHSTLHSHHERNLNRQINSNHSVHSFQSAHKTPGQDPPAKKEPEKDVSQNPATDIETSVCKAEKKHGSFLSLFKR